MKFTRTQVYRAANKLGVNFDNVDLDTLMEGVKVELEHGLIDKRTNVSNDRLDITLKIALAHIVEFPDYYVYLDKMERRLERKWAGRQKPRVFRPRTKNKSE